MMIDDVRLLDLCHGNIMECNGMYCNVLGCNECMNICMYIHTYTKYVYMGIHGYTRICMHTEVQYIGKGYTAKNMCYIYIYMWEYVLYISYIYSQNAVLHK